MAQESATACATLSSADLSRAADFVYHLCLTQQQVLQDFVTRQLNVAQKTLSDAGTIRVAANEPVSWKAINRFSKAESQADLGTFYAGSTKLTPNYEASTATPIVDDVKNLITTSCTIYQLS